MKRVTNRFERGSGLFTCRVCSRKTRSTGRGDNENCRLCVECFELAGIENSFMDGHGDANMLTEATRLFRELEQHGVSNPQRLFDIPDSI